jgi:signal transduction histidine kinase
MPGVLTVALAGLLGVLAYLQYQWVGQISIAERERMEESLEISTRRFGDEISGELTRIGLSFGFGRGPGDRNGVDRLERSFEFWRNVAPYPDLVRDVYAASRTPDGSLRLDRLDPASGTLGPVPWPESMDPVRERIEFPPDAAPLANLVWPPPGPDSEDASAMWMLLPGNIPPAVGRFSLPGTSRDQDIRIGVVIDIDAEYFGNEVLPALMDEHFTEDEYLVGIFRGEELLFSSTEGTTSDAFLAADETENLVRGSQERGRGRGRDNFGLRVDGVPWELRVKHRSGSLESAVGELRRRNLVVGFGILGLLGISGALTIMWAERARLLGRMQMEFAAGMSHELRTPLATIRTAAHNIASGLVREPEQVREYAEMVQNEGRRLSTMVDQVIQFAQTESGRRQYVLKPVPVGRVIAQAITITFPNAEDAKRLVEVHIPDNLPEARVDETALTHVLVNLLSNAMKYGVGTTDKEPDAGIRIDVRHDISRNSITLRVSDSGPGIDSADLPHVFEAYYRGRNSTSIPGSGLGLNLVQKMMEGQGGRVRAGTSESGGAAFTLQIPAIPPNDNSQPE